MSDFNYQIVFCFPSFIMAESSRRSIDLYKDLASSTKVIVIYCFEELCTEIWLEQSAQAFKHIPFHAYLRHFQCITIFRSNRHIRDQSTRT